MREREKRPISKSNNKKVTVKRGRGKKFKVHLKYICLLKNYISHRERERFDKAFIIMYVVLVNFFLLNLHIVFHS